jgi:mono/diheme cytochrome c family protein
MHNATRGEQASHPILWTLAAIIAVAIIVSGYVVLGPGPTDFAGGKRLALSAYHAGDPTGVPPELKSASLVERGEYLTRAADCVVCHTAEGGTPFAGGRGFVLPFGTLYSTNITPDVETGIGSYTDANFLDAVHKGIGRHNTKLYPAMPYASYTYMSDADALAIKAYLFTLKPVHAAAPSNTLVFPFNQRSLMSIWSLLFNPDKRYEPNVERSAEWNRGAYLAEAMEHCGECHTPRNLFFALNNRQKFSGSVQGGWRAYNITPDRSSGVGAWSDADLVHYLSIGHADGRGTSSGPMGEAVDESLSHLKPSDIGALPRQTCQSPKPILRPPRPLTASPPTWKRTGSLFMKAPVRVATVGPGSVRSYPLRRSPVSAQSTIQRRITWRRSSSGARSGIPPTAQMICRRLATRTQTPRLRASRTTSLPDLAPSLRN